MSAIAVTTGREIEGLCKALAHRGHRITNASGTGWAVGIMGRDGEARSLRTQDAGLICSGSISFPPDIIPRLQENLHGGLNLVTGPGITVFVTGTRLIVSRDGAGGRALCYRFANGEFTCASETKAFLALESFTPRLRPGALAQFLAYSFVPGPETMLRDVFTLPAGCYLEIDLTDPRPVLPQRWFFPEHNEARIPLTDGVAAFRETFRRSVEDLLPQAGASPALFLSGGLDSSCVAAELARDHSETLHTYALHFGQAYAHELDFARQVVNHCGLRNHHEILITPRDFIPRLEAIVWALDEPIGDPVALPNFELAALVAKSHTAVFNGEGGDPLFGGPKNFHLLLHHWYGLPHHSDARHREKQYLASYRRAYEEISRLLTPEFRRTFDADHELESPLAPFFALEKPDGLLNKLMLINQRLKGAHLIQPKVERMLAAHDLRPLSPLFSEEMIRLSLAVHPTAKLSAGQDKVIMKQAFAGRLPDTILHRPKSGMRVPVHFWMQKEMKAYVRESLSPAKLKADGIFDHRRVAKLLRYETEEGPGRYGLRLWMLMTFQLWKERFGVGNF
jgi:asparagine synthase (glutamine-hydrolysing)